MANESGTAARWIYQTLAPDATIQAAVGAQIYDSFIPQGAQAPYIVIREFEPASRDIMGVGPVRVKADLELSVVFIKAGNSFVEMEPVVARIDELLHGKAGTPVGGGTILACTRRKTIKFAEPDDGVVYRHLGGLYFLQVQ